jgi:hypothetical protein
MKNLNPQNHASFTRLQRPSLLPKVAFWSFLAVLFSTQQIATAFAHESTTTLQTAPQFSLFAPEVLVSFAAVIAIGIVAIWLVWDRARITGR